MDLTREPGGRRESQVTRRPATIGNRPNKMTKADRRDLCVFRTCFETLETESKRAVKIQELTFL